MLAAVTRGKLFDSFWNTVALILFSLPVIWTGSLAIAEFANPQRLAWFPSAGIHSMDTSHMTAFQYANDYLWHIVLPNSISGILTGVILQVSRAAGETAPAELEHQLMSLFRLCLELGGTLSGEHGLGLAKRDAFAALADPFQLHALRALKRALDPRNVLNPAIGLGD